MSLPHPDLAVAWAAARPRPAVRHAQSLGHLCCDDVVAAAEALATTTRTVT